MREPAPPRVVPPPPVASREPVREPGTVLPDRVPAQPAGTQAESLAPATAPRGDPAYEQQLLAWLERYKRYPRRAQRRQVTGTVQVRFSVQRSGQLIDVSVVRSSGSQTLDRAALDMVHRADPLPAPPDLLQQLVFEVPVVFALQ